MHSFVDELRLLPQADSSYKVPPALKVEILLVVWQEIFQNLQQIQSALFFEGILRNLTRT